MIPVQMVTIDTRVKQCMQFRLTANALAHHHLQHQMIQLLVWSVLAAQEPPRTTQYHKHVK